MTTTSAQLEAITTLSTSHYEAPNETEADKVAAIAASMEANGWQGAPIVVSAYDALTGSHRIAAAREVGIAVPVVTIEDLCEMVGIDWADEVDSWGNDWLAATRLTLPADVADYLGWDCH